ncbi:MAG TPA: cellulase family glycosylhydrolase [Stenomitos sp.]
MKNFNISKRKRHFLFGSSYYQLMIIVFGLFLLTYLIFADFKESVVYDSPRQKSNPYIEYRLENLTKGVNLSGWFSHGSLTPKDFQSKFKSDDIQLIRKMGFRHIRLPVNPEILFNKNKPDELNIENIEYLDSAVEEILRQNLAVIIDLHALPQSFFFQELFNNERFLSSAVLFWESLARHFSQYSPDKLFLEVFNEPATENPHQWNLIQDELIKGMRRGAPKHTLIADANLRAGNAWDAIAGLESLVPVQDSNVIYNFHFYEPMLFTHQGADWVWKDVAPYLRNLPYPSKRDRVLSLFSQVKNTKAYDLIKYYSDESWNSKKIESLIERAVKWATTNKVYLTCNEFGVYRLSSLSQDRYSWHKDVRILLEKYKIGWSVWEYSGGFGVTNKNSSTGMQEPDTTILSALFAMS